MRKLNKKIIIVIIAVAVVLILFLASATGTNRDSISGLEGVVRDASAPLKGGVTSLVGNTSAISDNFVDVDQLLEENTALKERVASLEAEVAALQDAKRENSYLKDLLNIADELADWQPVASTVVARSSKSWYNTITIKGGKDQGFSKNMPVITAEGLVGRINLVSATTAEVLLIIDQECAVSAVVQTSQTAGVVAGNGYNSDSLYMIHIPADAKISTGQTVISSGLGGIFPRGLRIGYINNVTSVQGGLMQQATVEPFVDFDRLSNVLVLTNVTQSGGDESPVVTQDHDEENREGQASGIEGEVSAR